MISTAISTINNSVDGAISRIDTLNNFPKVMQNMGISSEEGAKAIQKISEGLKGLPTTLNDGALAVQRFTSKNGDVNKSTEYFLALNNALLAGGAGAEIQSSALEQLSQSYSKGKPDMMEWRTLMTAMPAQLNQVAKAMGYTNTDKLGEDLRKGKVSMEKFMNTLVKLNKEGTGEFLSFEQQARNSVDGIRTSITNAKTAVTRGVANIIESVNSALKKTQLKSLANVINKIGNTFEKVLKKVANSISKIDLNSIIKRLQNIGNILSSNIKKILETITNILRNLIKYTVNHKEAVITLTSTIIGLVTAFKALQIVMKAIQTINMVKGVIGALNPVSLLVVGITALTTAFVLSQVALAKYKTSLGGLRDEAKAQQTTWKELKESREQFIKSSASEIATNQKLADELRQITDENGKVKDGYENRAKYILGELNTALGTEYKMNGNIISNYKELKENIDQLILAKKAEATLNAYKSEYETAIKSQAEATETLVGLRKQLNDEMSKTAKNYKEETEKRMQITYIGNEIKKQTELIGEYGYTIQNYEKLTSASVSGNAEEINRAVQSMTTSYETAKAKVKTSLNEQINSQTQYVNLLEKCWQEAKSRNDSYQEQILRTQLETQQKELKNLAKSLAQQTSTVDNLSDEQIKAWKNLAESSWDAYREGLSNLDTYTQIKIQKATGKIIGDVGLSNESGKLAERAVKEFNQRFNPDQTVSSELNNAGRIMRTDKQVENGASALAASANIGFNNNVNGNKWGQDLSNNISSGMTSQSSKRSITGASSLIAGWIKSIIGHSVPKEGPLKDELTYMPDMIDNLVYGINKNKYKVTKAVYGLTSDMENKLKNAVNFEIGNMNATASVQSNSMYKSNININAKFEGDIEMNGEKTARILTPYMTKNLRTAGVY